MSTFPEKAFFQGLKPTASYRFTSGLKSLCDDSRPSVVKSEFE
jgi:hypothetical protein